MVGGRALACVLLGAILAGCAGSDHEPVPGPQNELLLAAAVEMTFSVDLFGTPWTIGALAWPVPGAETAVLLVHGGSGVKENYFATAPELGASMGARIASEGRTAIAIDLPGYGGSQGALSKPPFPYLAEAVRAVAMLARGGDQGLDAHAHVAAYGISLGAIVVNIAASGSDLLDAIIPASYPLSEATAAGWACRRNPACPEKGDLYHGEFYIPNIDWAVANATIQGYETGHNETNTELLVVWDGTPCSLDPLYPCTPRYGEVVARDVRAAVFTMVGDHEIPYLGTDLSQEPGYYPNAAAVETWVVPDAGHLIHNHRNQPEVVARIGSFLGGQSI